MSTLPQHHPDQNTLIEFAAGSLDHAQAIAVSTHLHYCSRCRNEVRELEMTGGAVLESSQQTSALIDEDELEQSFQQLMSKISTQGQLKAANDTHNVPVCEAKYEHLPKVLKKMLTDHPVTWKRVTPELKSAHLIAGQNKYGVSLQKIKAGGQVPEHDHRGTEITVVLKGSFSDEDSVYHQGDFLLKDSGDTHRPTASINEDCLCLSVEQAPVKLTSLFGRMINPFLRIKAM